MGFLCIISYQLHVTLWLSQKEKKKKNKFNLKKIYGVLISFFILGQGGFTASMTGQVYVYLCGTEDAL